jgi:hypothetical protein
MRVVNAHVNEGYNASTPVELAYVLVSNGGVRNTDVILIMNNRSAVEQIIQTCTKYQTSRWAEYTTELGPMQYSHFPSQDAGISLPVLDDNCASEEEEEIEEHQPRLHPRTHMLPNL